MTAALPDLKEAVAAQDRTNLRSGENPTSTSSRVTNTSMCRFVVGHEQASFDFACLRRFEEESNSLLQIRTIRPDGIPLACDIEFGAEPDIAVALALNDRGKLRYVLHDPILA
jgi:hypothetical protein